MNKTELTKKYEDAINTLTMLRINADWTNVTVVAGGAMVMFGLRDSTDDLDINVPPDIYYRVREIYPHKVKKLDSGTCPEHLELQPGVDLHSNTEVGAAVTNGVRHQSIQQLLDFKLELDRPKDQDDILKLKNLSP